jgi:hypothetical protein
MDLIDSKTPWTGDQLCRKVATYTRQKEDGHPCIVFDSNPLAIVSVDEDISYLRQHDGAL